jgi:hypothetical protein
MASSAFLESFLVLMALSANTFLVFLFMHLYTVENLPVPMIYWMR